MLEGDITGCHGNIWQPWMRKNIVTDGRFYVSGWRPDTSRTDDCTRRVKELRRAGITPAKEGVLALIRKVGALIRAHVSAPMLALVKKLNQTLRGWGNYHRHVVASETFARIDQYVREQLWRMLRHRHPRKSQRELIRKYWTEAEGRHIFTVKCKTEKGPRVYTVIRLGALPAGRHIKIPKDANPYQPEYARLFGERRHKKERRMTSYLSARQYRARASGRMNSWGSPQGNLFEMLEPGCRETCMYGS